MKSALLERVRADGHPLVHLRSLIAATDRDERSLRVALVLVHEAVRRGLAASTEPVVNPSGPRFDTDRWRVDRRERMPVYEALVERVRERTMAVVPPGARVAMVSRGDQRLLDLHGRVVEHFPQDRTGSYAGYYPESAGQAIQLLLELESRGVEFVVFPATAFWWFEFYSGLARWLTPALAWCCEDCAVYELLRVTDGQEGWA
jgi:hypothetical protein